ncbi:MAG: cytochrome c3 family protein [Phycisphaerae bacterium]
MEAHGGKVWVEPAEGEGHRFRLVEQGADLCMECHDEDDKDFPLERPHAPVKEGRCLDCHDPHDSAVPGLLKGASQRELCLTCHADVTKDVDFLHGPVASGPCTACHNPHASDEPALLTKPSRDTCLSCHSEIGAPFNAKPVQHAPVAESCTACHNPHGGDNRMNLTQGGADLCLDCHETIADLMDDASVTHGALTTGKACLSCHDPHAADLGGLLRSEPMQLCLSCHNQAMASKSGSLVDMKRLLAENPNHHGPIQQGDCTACHAPHGGERHRLLTEAYPRDFYAPYDEEQYALCFGCHEAEMMEDAETDELTEFRNGTRNLHFLHVNRSVKGRTCRACHAAHASRRPKQITESVPFGQWILPLDFEKTDTGGSCLPGCHKRYRYDRESAVDNFAP